MCNIKCVQNMRLTASDLTVILKSDWMYIK